MSYKIGYNAGESKSFVVGFDLKAEEVGGYTFNKDYLSIEYNNDYIQSIKFQNTPTIVGGGYRV